MIDISFPYYFMEDLDKIVKYNEKLQKTTDDRIKIQSLYGSFPNCLWNGGRLSLTNPMSSTEAATIIKKINGLGFSMNLTFTNSLLKELHLRDYKCNSILDYLACNPNNAVIVNSELLRQYIRSNYPELKIICSITKGNRLEDFIKYKDTYDISVIYAKDEIVEYINKHDIDKRRIEVLLNSGCGNCRNIILHNDLVSAATLGLDAPGSIECFNADYRVPSRIAADVGEIANKGFSLFKIQGRREPIESTFNYIDNNFDFIKKL